MRALAILLAGTAAGLACALPSPAQNLSTFGTPGLIDMPTAEVLPDGNLAFSSSLMRNTNRNTMTFQMLPRIYGSFRYSYIRDYDQAYNQSRYDRSFDLHFQLIEENRHGLAVAAGLRDFGGTGIYSSEYLAATKRLGGGLTATAGLGWGRLAGRNSFGNPLGVLSDRFDTRPAANAGGIEQTGRLDFGSWFRGDAAVFGGLRWNVNPRLSLMAEYSPDLYVKESSREVFEIVSPLNIGASYRFDDGTRLSGYYMYGSTLGVQLSFVIDPRKAPSPGGQGPAAPALQPISTTAAASWNLPPDRGQSAGAPRLEEVLRRRLAEEGLRLTGFSADGDRAEVFVENLRYGAAAQAAGRTARVMANTLPREISDFTVTLTRQGVVLSSVQSRRSDYYALEADYDGAWRSLARAQILDLPDGLIGNASEGAFPYFAYRFGPYMQASFFDPDSPVRVEAGAELSGSYTLSPGLSLSADLRLPVVSTLKDTTRESNSVLPHVRSDWATYAQESDLRISHLTAEYIWRPQPDYFARVTAGYLEDMFGGISAELLWFPIDSRFAIGGELNYVRQRDYDILFGFQDYGVATGHASLYYDIPGDYLAQVDMGRYLAGDWGATFSLDREFNNGFKVGAFFTLTDVSAEEFGEGSFDKGIRMTIPLSLLTSRPSRGVVQQTIRPVLRDGGARLSVRNRLYNYTRGERAQRLASRWGRYFR